MTRREIRFHVTQPSVWLPTLPHPSTCKCGVNEIEVSGQLLDDQCGLGILDMSRTDRCQNAVQMRPVYVYIAKSLKTSTILKPTSCQSFQKPMINESSKMSNVIVLRDKRRLSDSRHALHIPMGVYEAQHGITIGQHLNIDPSGTIRTTNYDTIARSQARRNL